MKNQYPSYPEQPIYQPPIYQHSVHSVTPNTLDPGLTAGSPNSPGSTSPLRRQLENMAISNPQSTLTHNPLRTPINLNSNSFYSPPPGPSKNKKPMSRKNLNDMQVSKINL